tara:strand:+ start:1296 stop:2099 length:804 start_codon:yes stop_codon:yes gene_type:complete
MEFINNFRNLVTTQGNRGLTLLSGDSISSKILKVIIAMMVIYIVINLSKTLNKKFKNYKSSSPWILKGTKVGNKRMIVLQDPSKENALTLGRSENEKAGLEFTYSFWMHINDLNYKHGQWKHIMHKGNDSSWPNRSPGVWLHPKKNAMRVYMNTFKHIAEYTDIEDLPVNKWFHVVIAVRQRNLDVFINGNLVKRHNLEGIPKQNYGDLFINAWRGFGGFMSNIRYYDYYISYSEMDTALSIEPAVSGCVDSNDVPPYFTPNWWTKQ